MSKTKNSKKTLDYSTKEVDKAVKRKFRSYNNKQLLLNYQIIAIILSILIKKYNPYPYIVLKFAKIGNIKIYSNEGDNTFTKPNEIYLNEERKTISSQIDLSNINNDVKLVFSSNTINLKGMFEGCSEISEIHFFDFDTAIITDMSSMFYGCSSLISLNLSSLDTSNLKYMNSLFSKCSNLTTLDLSNFDTSKVEDMNNLFSGCSSLKELDLSNFNTSQVTDMSHMFYGCYSLLSLNMKKFDTSKVIHMQGMFSQCKSLSSLDISNYDVSNVMIMNSMFEDCSSLEKLNLSSLIILKSILIQMSSDHCKTLKILNIEDYILSRKFVLSLRFYGCDKLQFINFNNIQFGYDLDYIFGNFQNNITEYATNNGTYNTGDNFIICINNNSLLYDKTITNSKIDIGLCSDNCPKELPFRNEITTECIKHCDINDFIKNKCSLNYSNYEGREDLINNYIKNNINKLDTSILKEKIFIEIKEKYATFKLINYNHINEVIKKDESIENCANILKDFYDIENDNNLVLFTVNIYKWDERNIINKTLFEFYSNLTGNYEQLESDLCEGLITKGIKEECSEYSIESIINDACIKCNIKNEYYPIYNETFNKNFTKCYKEIDGYYLDNITKSFKIIDQCYDSCQTCKKIGNNENHYCKECKSDYPFEYIEDNHLNCFEFCHNNNYNENNDTYQCLQKPKCFGINNKLISDKDNKCIDKCENDETYKYEFKKTCYKECPKDISELSKNNLYLCEPKCSSENPYINLKNQQCIKKCDFQDILDKKCELNYKNSTKKAEISKTIIENIKNGTMKEVIAQVKNSNESFVIKEGEDAHLISTLGTNLKRKDFSSIDFGDCEKLIKSRYGLDDKEELILYEVEHGVEGFNIPILEYVLFTEDGKTELNLSICDTMKVQYYIPVSIDENDLDMHDPSSDFYNNECNKHSTEDGVDMTLYDRQKQYNDNNMALCEKGCINKGLDPETEKIKCDCYIKSDMNYYSNNTKKEDLLDKIDSQKSSSNLKVTKCINNVFSSPEQLFSNSGFVSLLIVMIIFIIIFIIFCIKGKEMIEKKIDETIYNKFEKEQKKEKNNNNYYKKNNNTIHKNNKILNKNNKNNNIKGIAKGNKINTKLEKIKKTEKLIKKPKAIESKKKVKKINISHSNIKSKSKKNSKGRLIESNNNNLNLVNNNRVSPIIIGEGNSNEEVEDPPDKENDYELNTLPYHLAIIYDKRTGCDYYSSQLKNKQLFLFTFCSFNDYNSGIIKKFIFFLSFALHYTISALFFTDDNLHQILLDEGKYNVSYQLPFIIISAVSATFVLRIMLETLILTDRNILQVKRQSTKNKAVSMKITVLKRINVKFAIFFIINFILLCLFWFYLTCLNDTYENTQIYLIENTFFSFGISFAYPFIWNIIPTIFRTMALDTKNADRSCLYTLSRICQLF